MGQNTSSWRSLKPPCRWLPGFSDSFGRCVLGTYARSVQDLRSNDKPHFFAGWRIMPLYTQFVRGECRSAFPCGPGGRKHAYGLR